MFLFVYLILLLRLVQCAFIDFSSQNDDLVWESDVPQTFVSETQLAGEPFLPHTQALERVSASSQGPIRMGSDTTTVLTQSNFRSISIVSANLEGSSKSMLTLTRPISATQSDILTNPDDSSLSFTSSFTVTSNDRVTTLLTKTASTTTSNLFSTSVSVPFDQINGTIITTISTGTANPLVTQQPSFSSQQTIINPSTLSSNKTITMTSHIGASSNSGSYLSNSTYSVSLLSPTKASSGSTQTITGSVASQTNNMSTEMMSSLQSSAIYTASTGTDSRSSGSVTSTRSDFQSASSVIYPSWKVNSSSSISDHQSQATETTSLSLVSTFLSRSSSKSVDLSSASSSVPTTSSSTTYSPSTSSTKSSSSSTTTIEATTIDIFQAVSTDEPPIVFPRAQNPMNISDGVTNDGPIQTNKFYTNLMVGSQESAAFVYPYSLWKYSSGTNYGLAVQHTVTAQYTFGDYDSDGNSEFLINPLDIAHVVLSAVSFDEDMSMEINEMTLSSTTVTLAESNDSNDYLEIPLVQGMGFTTGIYHGTLNAKIASGVGFETLSQETSEDLADGILKYRITLLNGVSWLCYAIVPDGIDSSSFTLQATSTYSIISSSNIDGLILQLAVAPDDTDLEVYYDQAAGMYVTDFQLQGLSDGAAATYEFSYSTQGTSASGNTMIFSLPHHESSLTSAMADAYTGIELQSTTKGTMKGYLTTSLQFFQSLNTQISWLPWSSQLNSTTLEYSTEQLILLAEVANAELQVSISSSIDGLNTYYLGKVIDKYAYVLLTVSQILGDSETTESTLANIKSAFDILLLNEQFYPLIYDTKFNGIVSSGDWASTTTGYDFGNTYYNDHHFHYGYIIHAAAVVGYVDAQLGGSWAMENKDWVNSLVRDVANPSTDDVYFAQSRMFDWYHGHSWAAGLFENGNGKNEESSSEDYNFAYGMKLWGSVVGDQSMELRGDLMISIMSDSMNAYFLYEDNNDIEPEEIIGNKVSGILFDNIIDYTTYFGQNVEYIHGIHMLPITPVSSQIRREAFVQQEWEEKISPIIASLESSWCGILMLNEALFDPASSYSFFSNDDLDWDTYLDNGMSRTWSLAFSGGLANSLGLL